MTSARPYGMIKQKSKERSAVWNKTKKRVGGGYNGSEEDLFFRCKKCGTVMTEADFAFNRETGEKECVCGHCAVGRGTFRAYKAEHTKKKKSGAGRFFAKNIFRYLFPYLLYGELLYLALTGVRDKTIFLFRGLFVGISDIAGWIGLGVDIALMLVGLAAIIYSAKCFYDGDGFTGYEQAREQYTMTTYSESWTGKVKGKSQDVTVYNDNIYLNIMIFIWNFFKVLFLTVFGLFIFIVIAIKYAKATRGSKKKSQKGNPSDELCKRFDRILSEKSVSYTITADYSDEEWARRAEDAKYLPEEERMRALSNRYSMCADGESYAVIDDGIPLARDFEEKDRFKVKNVYLLARSVGEKAEIKFLVCGDRAYFIPYREELFDSEIGKYCPSFSYCKIPRD